MHSSSRRVFCHLKIERNEIMKRIVVLPVLGHSLASSFRSGLIARITQTASSTNFTAAGGFFIDLTMVMSGGLSVFRAANAALNAGIASCRSLSQSSLIACAAAAASLAAASSAPTTSFFFSASAVSRSMVTMICSVSSDNCFNFGCKSNSFCCMSPTCFAAFSNFSRPVVYRSRFAVISLNFSAKRSLNCCSISTNDDGVT